MRHLLDAVYIIASLFLMPVWIVRALRTGEYINGLWQKLAGIAPARSDDRPVIWFHAVSIGEVFVLRPLLECFQSNHPSIAPVLSTFSRGGHEAARMAFPSIPVFYAPLDLSCVVRRTYSSLRPRMLVLSELELWPNLLLEAKRRNVPVVVVNSRINDVDLRFYRRINRLHRPALRAISWWGAQTHRDAERILELLGAAPATQVQVTGSLKYEAAVEDCCTALAQELRSLLGFSNEDRIFVAGSTHAPEEHIVIQAFENLRTKYPRLRLVIAPRNPGRFSEVANLLRSRGTEFARRSSISKPRATSSPVTLVDSVGELPAVWSLADFAFVGGTLSATNGGQNMIEPASLSKPICFGPNVWNFQEPATGLLAANGAVQVQSAAHIVAAVTEWLERPDDAAQMGRAARAFVRSRAGAAECTIRAMLALLRD